MSDEHEGGGIGGSIEVSDPPERAAPSQRLVPRTATTAERRSVLTADEMRRLVSMYDAMEKGRIPTLEAENAQLRGQLGQCERGLMEHRQALEILASRITALAQQVVSRNTRYGAMDLAVKYKAPGDSSAKLVGNAGEILKFLEAGDQPMPQVDGAAGWVAPEGTVSH